MTFDELLAKVREKAQGADVSTMDMTNFNKLIDGKLDPILAFTTGKLKVDGDAGKALEFSKLVK